MNKKKIGIISGIVVGLIAIAVGTFLYINNSSENNAKIEYEILDNDFKLNREIKLEYAKKVIDPKEYIDVTNGELTVDPTTINLEEVGLTEVTYTLTSKDGSNEEQLKCAFVVEDTKAPTITLASDVVEVETMDDLDVDSNITSVEDPVEGPLSKVEEEPAKLEESQDGRVYEVGWYTVIVNDRTVNIKACDNHGNVTEKSYAVNATKSENTPDPNKDVTTLWYYPSVDLNDGSAWVQLSSHYDWYYTACTYLSGKYSTAEEALQDVVNHEASIGNTDNVENNARIFMEKDESGNVVYYQAGYEE